MNSINQDQNNPLSPESLKEHPIVFFDGICGLCNRSVDFIIKRDQNQIFRFSPLQGETAQKCLSAENLNNINNMVFIDQTGQYSKSSGAVCILQRLNGGWSILGKLLWIVPKPIRDFGYIIIAKYRYQMFGKSEACRLPKPEEINLFLP